MTIAWGVILVIVGSVAWVGQAVSWLAPDIAVRLTLMEAEDSVEPAYWADIRGEAAWDALTLWTMPVAGVLLAVDGAAWPHFGLVAGASYAYFGGRGIFTRLSLLGGGFRVGEGASVRIGLVALGVWGVVGVITIVAAAVAL
jgi:hypothetical protein